METEKTELANPIFKLRKLGGHLRDLIESTFYTFPRALIEHSHALLVIGILTILLILAQELFLWACPALIIFSAPIALFLDMIFIFVDLLLGILGGAFDIILDIMKLLHIKTSLKQVPAWPFTTSKGVLALPSASSIKEWIVETHSECGGPSYFNAYSTLNYALASVNGNEVCHFVRYMYPIPWLFDFFSWSLGGFYLGSAIPNAAPSDTQDNCLLADKSKYYMLPPTTCIALGTGWILLEVVIPFFIGIIFLARCGTNIWNLLKDVVRYSLDIIKDLIF